MNRYFCCMALAALMAFSPSEYAFARKPVAASPADPTLATVPNTQQPGQLVDKRLKTKRGAVMPEATLDPVQLHSAGSENEVLHRRIHSPMLVVGR